MKTSLSIKAGLIVLAAACFCIPANGALLLYDGFDYTTGQPLAPNTDTTASPNPGQHNVAYNVDWRYAGAAGNAAPMIASSGLTYTGLQAGTGKSVSYDLTKAGTSRIQISPTAISSGTVYWSALVSVSSLSSLATGNGALIAAYNNSAGPGTAPTVFGSVLRIRTDSTDPTKYNVGTGLSSATTGTTVQFGTTKFSTTDTVLVVGAYQFVAGANNDQAFMWIDPSAATFGAASAPTATLTSAPGAGTADPFTSLISFDLRNINSVGNAGVQIDELRVGTDWASVTPQAVPEVSSFLTIGLGGVFAMGAVWFGKRRGISVL